MEKWFLDLMVFETELRVREYNNETIKIYKALESCGNNILLAVKLQVK